MQGVEHEPFRKLAISTHRSPIWNIVKKSLAIKPIEKYFLTIFQIGYRGMLIANPPKSRSATSFA
jgi:hypothetical protein